MYRNHVPGGITFLKSSSQTCLVMSIITVDKIVRIKIRFVSIMIEKD